MESSIKTVAPTPEELVQILRAHQLWREGAGGARANLRYANLRYANLTGANLTGANLTDANLTDANLTDANLTDANLRYANLTDANLPTGEKWEEYLADVLPALLTAGGKSVAEIMAAGAWDCHTWTNCPMHAALAINGPSAAPALLQPRVRQFVQLFDHGLIAAKQVGGKWVFTGATQSADPTAEPK